MSAALKTTVAELGDSRVRVGVEVAPGEVQQRLESKARQLGRELKLPGFRRGKVPAPLVIQRVGRDAVLDQAIRDSLSGWYVQAIAEAGVVPVGDPKLDLAELPGEGQALEFSIEVGVVPTAELGGYAGLEVPRREPSVAEEQVEAEVQALRERLAKLETAERPATQGDFVVIDYLGSLRLSDDDGERLEPFEGGEGRDQLVELGGGNLIPGFEEALLGAAAGEQREVALTFPGDYSAEQLAGRDASFAVTVKEVKVKELPPLDDDLAIDAGFDDLQELREDIRARLLENDEARAEAEFRQAALDAAVAAAEMPLTPELVRARAQEMWERVLHSLAHSNISREAYLQISGREEPEILAEMESDAEAALRREAVLTAIVAAEQIEPTEQQLLEAIAPSAEREGVPAEQLLEQLRERGREDELREEVAARLAVELIAERAVAISPEQARAREQLWTPATGVQPDDAAAGAAGAGGSGAGAAGKLWTPTERSAAS
ncbi:MAG TPA: trigger factor [Solirubrobacteraceae bacterium]|nr:trigger factor [Solirubrobacteraceae bacterium]